MNNIVPLDQRNFQLFCNFIEHYYAIGFQSPLNEMLVKVYSTEGQDEKIVALAEEILGFGVTWIRSLLDNPGIWISDMIFSDRDSEQTGQAEEYLEKTFFTEERIHNILRVIITKYLVLTTEEL
jgi:hypothetical protein